MNSKPVVALEEVVSDLEQAIAHYSTWRTDGKAHVLALYDETVRWIEWNPDTFPRKIGSIQRAILKSSYYIVYFLQEERRTLILAVLDGRRRPSEIRRIIRGRKSGERP